MLDRVHVCKPFRKKCKIITPMTATSSIQCAAVATTAMLFKFYTTSIQGKKRFEGGGRPPEDQKFGIHDSGATVLKFGENFEAEQDRIVIVQNDLENIPMGLIVTWASALTVSSDTAQSIHIVLVSVFVLGRICHTLCFAYALQP